MKSRTRKYYENRKQQSGSKKGSANDAGYDEQNGKTRNDPKKNPAPPKAEDRPNEDSLESQTVN